METTHPTPSPNLANPSSPPFEPSFVDALRFWEPCRVLYNLMLTAVVLMWIFATWPHFRPALDLSLFLFLVFAAFLANLCYCAAYLVDIPLQCSVPRTLWTRFRWSLWVLGMLLALLFENYWIADEIYPFVG
jgi:hypothetical protein